MTDDSGTKRQAGITTRQMLASPKDSVFVWCNSRLDYPKALSRHLGREELKIVGPSWLKDGWRGLRLSGLVLDHALYLSDDEFESYRRARSCLD